MLVALLGFVVCSCRGGAASADTLSTVQAGSPVPDGKATLSETEVALPVTTDKVRTGELVLTIATTGKVASEADATLRIEVAGTVKEVRARPGMRLSPGDVILVLDPRAFDLSIRSREADVARAEQRYLEETVPESVLTRTQLTPRRKQAALVRSGLDEARIALEQAQLEGERAIVRAPFGGIIGRLEVAPGERVAAGQEITRIVDMDHLRYEAEVLDHDMPLVRVGAMAEVTIPGVPHRTVRGIVTAILPAVDSATSSGRAFIRATASDGLRPGMYADIAIEATRLRARRIIPATAIIERDGRSLVFAVQDGRARWTYIRPGRTNGRETEVLPDSLTGRFPLDIGTELIVSGHLTLTHDALVRVMPRDAETALQLYNKNERP